MTQQASPDLYHYVPSAQSENSHYQLFDLEADPFEQNNLAGVETARLRRTMKGLIAALERHRAVYPEAQTDGAPLKPQLP
jgi:hypothetical protein